MNFKKKTTEDMITRVYQYEMYPTKEQEEVLDNILETQRHLYNNALGQRIDAYQFENRTLTLYEQKKQLITAGKKLNENLAAQNTGVCQQTLIRLDRAFAAFFRRLKIGEKPGFPRFCKFGQFKTFQYNSHGNGCKLLDYHTYLQGVGNVKTYFYRPLPEGAIVKTLSVSKTAYGWYVNIFMDLPMPHPEVKGTGSITLLTGMESIIYTNVRSYEIPQSYRLAQEKLIKAQQRVSRRQKGSNRRKKAVALLAKHHAHVANQRKEWQRLVAKRLVDRYATVFHEDIHLSKHVYRPLAKPNPLHPDRYLPNGAEARAEINKAYLDNAWNQFFKFLRDASIWTGTAIVAVPQFDPTQRCSQCGAHPSTFKIGEFTHGKGTVKCDCGMSMIATENNIKNITDDGKLLLGSKRHWVK